MLRQLIDITPFWWMQFICIALLTSITLGAAYISPRFFSLPYDKDHNDRSNALIAILSGGISILLAFIIFNTWNVLLKAQDNASQEANSLAIMMRNIAVFPETPKMQISQAIRNYTVAVRVDEWASMQKGYESMKAANAINELYRVLQSYEPITTFEQIYYSQALLNLNTVLKIRRERLNQLNSVIPSRLSTSLIVGSIILALVLGLIRGRTKFLDQIGIALFAVVLGFNIAIALSFDFPFSGEISVKNRFFYAGVLNSFPD